jgi:hypothetical protein
MSFTIGRASLPVDPSSARWSGDQLTITGWISPTTANDTNHAYALRQQLLGLVNNPDEQVLPCTFSVDPNWDGYYYVNSVNVAGDPGLMEIQGRMPYSITLTRLAGYGRPLMEVVALSAVRTNTFGIAAPTGILVSSVTSGAAYYLDTDFPGALGVTGTNIQQPEGGGFVVPWLKAAPSAVAAGTYFVAPGSYYNGACMFEVLYGSTYRPVMGMQTPQGIAGNWRLSNGLVRCFPTGTTNIQVEVWTGTVWESATFIVTASAGASTVNFTGDATAGYYTPLVMRNAPDGVSIRIRNGVTTYSLSIARSSRLVTMTWAVQESTADLGMKAGTAAAATAITGGIRRTADDTNGNRFVICSQGAFTSDLVNGGLYLTAAAASGAIGFGLEFNGSTSTSPNSATEMRDQFFGPSSTRHAVIVR